MPATLTRSINNPSFDEHLHSLRKKGTDLKKHNDCGDCKICHYNHLFVLGCGSHNSVKLPRSPTVPSQDEMCSSTRPQLGSGARSLRAVTVLCWIPAFGFALPHGILTGILCPVLGIIPMTISLLAGLIHLWGGARRRGANIFVDVFTAMFLIGILIPSWIFVSQSCYGWRCYGSHGLAMVGTYATVPMMVNFCIHTWFVLREINWRKINPFSRDPEDDMCPHCHGDISKKARSKQIMDTKENFTPVTLRDAADQPKIKEYYGPHRQRVEEYDEYDVEDRGRPSTDDENAPLV